MHNLLHAYGQTRSANCRDHLLHTPDAFIRIPLPGIERGLAIVHASAALGAGFIQYTAELEQGGRLTACADQRFLYILDGEARIVSEPVTNAPARAAQPGASYSLRPGSYAYLPAGAEFTLVALAALRMAVIEKTYQPHPSLAAPAAIFGHEDAVAATPLMGNTDLSVRALIPDSPAYDFAVNTMTYQPGAALSLVEVHVMEHGLLMLAGGGIYRLGEQWYPVAEGDFIWMAPFCPQWFGALGKQPAKYLIYKDFHRHPSSGRHL